MLLVLERHRLGFPQLRLQLVVEHRAVEKAEHHRQQQQRLENPLLLSGAHPVSHSPAWTPRRGRPAAAVPSSPMPERAPQQRPPQEVAGRSMRRRRETQKRGPKGSGARSAPARHGARSHRRRLGSGRQTFARLALRECPGPRGGPPHTSERTVPAPVPRRRLPFFLLPTFWLGCPRRRLESRPGRSPPPRGGSHCATLLPPEGGGARPTKGPGSRRRLRARPAGVGGRAGAGRRGRVWGMAGRCHWRGCRTLAAAASHPTYVSPTAPLFWPTGFREEVPLGLPAHWARPSRRSLPSGRQCGARLDARFVRPTPGPRLPSHRGGPWRGGSVGRAAAWRRGAPTWSAGGWGEAAEPGAGRLGCRGAVSWLAAGRGTVRTCVRVQVSVCVIQHSECTWGEEYSVYKWESGWTQLLTLCRIPFLSFPSRWADAADTRDGYTVSIICVAQPEMSCQLTLAPSRVLAWMRVCSRMAGRESGDSGTLTR